MQKRVGRGKAWENCCGRVAAQMVAQCGCLAWTNNTRKTGALQSQRACIPLGSAWPVRVASLDAHSKNTRAQICSVNRTHLDSRLHRFPVHSEGDVQSHTGPAPAALGADSKRVVQVEGSGCCCQLVVHKVHQQLFVILRTTHGRTRGSAAYTTFQGWLDLVAHHDHACFSKIRNT